MKRIRAYLRIRVSRQLLSSINGIPWRVSLKQGRTALDFSDSGGDSGGSGQESQETIHFCIKPRYRQR